LGYPAELWAQRCQNARQPYQELVRRGYRGSESMVRMVVRSWRTCQEGSYPARTPSQLTRLILHPAGRLADAACAALDAFLQANPLLGHGYQLKTCFQTLLAERNLVALEQWLLHAETSDLLWFQTITQVFGQDDDAIKAALTTPWSTGQCEGQICRVKLLERLGYGRAKLASLRQRVLHHVAVPSTAAEQCEI
jgi:transposase